MKWIWTLVVCLVVLIGGECRAAAMEDDGLTTALRTAPNGIPLTDLYEVDQVMNSSASRQDGPRVAQSIAQLTSGVRPGTQVSALWSKANGNDSVGSNQVDLTQDALWGFWLYFGNQGDKSSEGLAFVLQNANQKIVPIAKTFSGQSIGAWGSAPESGVHVSSETVALRGLSNSWALEFDTHVNSSEGTNINDFLDYQARLGPHIASGYPGKTESYKLIYKQGRARPALQHQQLRYMKNSPADGHWRHVTMSWKPATKQMTYAYHDRDVATNLPIKPEITDKVTIETKFLTPAAKTESAQKAQSGVTDALQEDGATRVNWGITSASTSQDNQMVIVDQDPRWPQIRVNSKVELIGEHAREITEGDLVAQLTAQDVVRFSSQIDFFNTGVLTGNHQLSNAVTVESGLPRPAVVTGITIKNGETTLFNVRDHSDTGITGDRHVQALAHQGQNRQLTTEREATFSGSNQVTTIRTPPTLFYGRNYYVSVPTPTFKVDKLLELKLTRLSDQLLTTADDDVVVKGQLTNGKLPIEAVDRDNCRFEVAVNGKSYQPQELKLGWTTTHDLGEFGMVVPPRLLRAGENEVTVRVSDQQNRTSNTLKIPISKTASKLAFATVPTDCGFVPLTLTGRESIVQRDPSPGWQLSVQDNRGAGHKWQLQVSMDKAFQDKTGRRLAGKLIYVHEDTSYEIDSAPTTVMTHQTRAANEVTDISKSWTNMSGPLIVVSGHAVAGNYEGEIRWHLTDAP
ncbi:lectin-like domain-containing protein [Levilactobacillus enshiensis]|uniref:lectin-like domain-containing protein n=1 Tax=Levilactobacillus enshiensis TaxID=2590213 RepID=UPI001179D1F6|nr:WxL domain-containing protein [Levilactobacillus enshiensis]